MTILHYYNLGNQLRNVILALNLIRDICLASGIIILAISAPAFADDRFIVMAFDDVATGADEAAYNACRDTGLTKINIPGLQSVQRFALNDVQMFDGVTMQLPGYLTLAEVLAEDEATVAKKVADSFSAVGPDCLKSDPAKALFYVYRASGRKMPRSRPDPKLPANGDALNNMSIL